MVVAQAFKPANNLLSRFRSDAMTTTSLDPVALDSQHVLQVYRRSPVVFTSGRGCVLVSREGDRYLDLLSGIGVTSLGHAHPALVRAIADQAATLIHTSNLFHHPLQSELATRLSELSGLPRAFFCNSGAEAVEACLKFARRYWRGEGRQERSGFVAFQHSFHGRTIGSLSVTWDEHYRAPFAPLLADVTFVSPADPAAVTAAITTKTAAVIVEPIQGEGGVRPLPRATAQAIADACRTTGALLIADEVQCGLGRTGRAFHSEALGLRPDLMALGKALGAGVPIGAALMSEAVAASMHPGDHGSTYGGNLLACRAALVFLEQLTTGGLMQNVTRVGAHLEAGLRSIAARQPAIKDVRGAGLMWGIELDRPAAPVVQAAMERKLLINRTSDTVVRLLPPYVISEREIDEALPILETAIAIAAEAPRS
jgi:predicted acetylornithine/succinylornithine family transaminase